MFPSLLCVSALCWDTVGPGTEAGAEKHLWIHTSRRRFPGSCSRSAQISRELLAEPGRCDAVAVGLIDRKHVGAVGTNRDAAAAGDGEQLRPLSRWKLMEAARSACLLPLSSS